MPAHTRSPASRQTGHVSRPRLSALLDATRHLTVVRGPVGAGKSTLVRGWVPASGGTVAHVEVARLADVSELWRATCAALGAGPCTAAAEEDCTVGCAIRTGRALDAPTTLVLDDFDLLADPAVEDDLAALLDETPRLRVVVTGRTATGLEGPPHDSRLDVQLVGPDVLAPTREEAASLLAAAGAPTISATALDAVLEAADGTLLGLRVLGLAATSGEIDLGRAAASVMRATVAAVHNRALFARPDGAGLATAAIPLAALDRIPAGLVVDLVDPDHAESILEDLARLGAGRWTGPDRTVLRLDTLVRDGLRPGFDALPRERRTYPRTAAARYALRHDDPMTALTLAVEADDLELASRVAMLHWRALSSAHRDATIQVVEQVDEHHFPRYPLLEVLLALALNETSTRQERSIELFASSIAHLQARRPLAELGEAVMIDGYLSGVLRQSGRSDEAVAAALRADRGVQRIPTGTSPDLDSVRSQIDEQNSMTLYASGLAVRSLDVLRRAFARDGERSTAWQSLTLLAGISAAEGDQHAADEHVETIRTLPWAPLAGSPYVRAFGLLPSVYAALERHDVAVAQELLDEIDDQAGANEHWVVFAHAQAYTDIAAGRAHVGLSRLARKRAAMGSRPLTPFRRSRVAALHAMLALGAGQGDRALAAVRDADTADLAVRVVLARTRYGLGEHETALTLLADPTGLDEAGPRLLAQRLLLLAGLCTHLGHPDAAVARAQDAAGVLDAGGIRLPLLVLPAVERDHLVTLLDDAGDLTSAAVLRDAPLDHDVLPPVVETSDLSDREALVLTGLARGHSTTSLAAELYVSTNTVRTQVKSIYRKLGATTRQEALAAALARGLLP